MVQESISAKSIAQTAPATENNDQQQPPSLTGLINLLADDMAQVNETILTRMTSDVPLIPQLAGHLIASGGKRMRPLMTLAGARIANANSKSCSAAAIKLATAVEFIHSATLLHDDVIDEGIIRRGKETLNEIWGNHSSVLIGDYLLSRCFEMMVEDGNLEILKLLSSKYQYGYDL